VEDVTFPTTIPEKATPSGRLASWQPQVLNKPSTQAATAVTKGTQITNPDGWPLFAFQSHISRGMKTALFPVGVKGQNELDEASQGLTLPTHQNFASGFPQHTIVFGCQF
jgi:hypothetical protein